MKFKISCNDDHIIIEGETIDEIREQAYKETSQRGWNQDDCWSERLKE